jgi:hypothetical protein
MNNTAVTLVRTAFKRNIVTYTDIPEWAGIYGSAAAVYPGAVLWLQVCPRRIAINPNDEPYSVDDKHCEIFAATRDAHLQV